MEHVEKRIKELKENVEKAAEELAETSSKYPPDSDAVHEAKYKRRGGSFRLS